MHTIYNWSFKREQSNFNLRNADFVIPWFKTVTCGKHSVLYLGPKLCARLLNHIKSLSLKNLKNYIRKRDLNILIDARSGCKCHMCSTWLLSSFLFNFICSFILFCVFVYFDWLGFYLVNVYKFNMYVVLMIVTLFRCPQLAAMLNLIDT